MRIDLLKHLERIDTMKTFSFKLNAEGQVDQTAIDTSEYSKKIYLLVKERVKSVSLKHVESGSEFKSLEEVEFYQEGVELINELGALLLGGLKLGKS